MLEEEIYLESHNRLGRMLGPSHYLPAFEKLIRNTRVLRRGSKRTGVEQA